VKKVGSENEFEVIPEQGPTWELRAADSQERTTWIEKIRQAINISAWLRHYEIGDVLGQGAAGVVRQCTDKRNLSKRFALKTIDLKHRSDRDQVIAEVEILKSVTNLIKHRNLIEIYKVYEEEKHLHLVTMLCTGGELYDSIADRGRYTEKDAAVVMSQIMEGIHALHCHNILHLDIKPENILYETPATEDGEACIKITDFGLSRLWKKEDQQKKGGAFDTDKPCGTVGYIAPEMITMNHISPAADVFSAGVILYILLVGYPPFYGDDARETLAKTVAGQLLMDEQDWNGISAPARNLVMRMLEVQVKRRITVEEVLAYPWIQQRSAVPDTPLGPTLHRMTRFNTTRKTKTASLQLARLFGEAGEAESGISLTERWAVTPEQKAVIEKIFEAISPKCDGTISCEQFILLSLYMGQQHLPHDRMFNFYDDDGDGKITAMDFLRGITKIKEHDDRFVAIIFDVYAGGPRTSASRINRNSSSFERLSSSELDRTMSNSSVTSLDEPISAVVGTPERKKLLAACAAARHFGFGDSKSPEGKEAQKERRKERERREAENLAPKHQCMGQAWLNSGMLVIAPTLAKPLRTGLEWATGGSVFAKPQNLRQQSIPEGEEEEEEEGEEEEVMRGGEGAVGAGTAAEFRLAAAEMDGEDDDEIDGEDADEFFDCQEESLSRQTSAGSDAHSKTDEAEEEGRDQELERKAEEGEEEEGKEEEGKEESTKAVVPPRLKRQSVSEEEESRQDVLLSRQDVENVFFEVASKRSITIFNSKEHTDGLRSEMEEELSRMIDAAEFSEVARRRDEKEKKERSKGKNTTSIEKKDDLLLIPQRSEACITFENFKRLVMHVPILADVFVAQSREHMYERLNHVRAVCPCVVYRVASYLFLL
jgi:serine/threonine protein kinase